MDATTTLAVSTQLADSVRVMLPAAVAFALGIAFAPVLAHYLYRYRTWKKVSGKGNAIGGGGTPVFDELHKEREVSTPRMGGILIWTAVLATALGLKLLGYFWGGAFGELDFVTRGQTWLPLAAIALGAIVGFVDDLFEISETRRGGLSLTRRLTIVALAGLGAGWWFYVKLGVDSVAVPFDGHLVFGPWFILFFAAVTLALYAGGTIDGIDGLAGGVPTAPSPSGTGRRPWRPSPRPSPAPSSRSYGSTSLPRASICRRRGAWRSRSPWP
jgi:UDP-N-acetylmuramyl pentapeptide phosphotransferase/UDP-N-acetylglucosamine-1-phosphate transferase